MGKLTAKLDADKADFVDEWRQHKHPFRLMHAIAQDVDDVDVRVASLEKLELEQRVTELESIVEQLMRLLNVRRI